MSNPTFNAGTDYYEMETATGNAVKVTSSNENRSKQSASGANCYGDAVVVDSFGETAAPSSEYQVVGDISLDDLELGTVHNVVGIEGPVVRGTLTINTSTGSAPTMSVSGQMVQSGATQLRSYVLPEVTLTARHRAQDFMGLASIKKGNSVARDIDDYGLESCNGTFPIEISLAQPKGVVMKYDIHGGMATCDYTMNWYASTAPTIELSTKATGLGATMSNPASKNCPEGGYTQYTWQISFPLVGEESEAPSGT